MISTTLRTLLDALYQAGMQVEYLRTVYHDPGRTADVVVHVALELQLLAESVHDEIRALERHGDTA